MRVIYQELIEATPTSPRCSCVKHHSICSRFADWFVHASATLYPTVDYEEFARTEKVEVSRSIVVDINRTFPNHAFFAEKKNVMSLKRVLTAYAALDEEIGYAQGLNFIVGFMLLHSGSEVTAFSLLVALMQGNVTYGTSRSSEHSNLDAMYSPMTLSMRQLFLPDLLALKSRCFIVQQICYEAIPDIFTHLLELGTSDASQPDTFLLLFTDVFLTLFTTAVPFLPLARIWDIFFSHGWLFLCHLCVARLFAYRRAILEADEMMTVHQLLRQQRGRIEEQGKWRRHHRESNRLWFNLATQALATHLADRNVCLRKAVTFTPENLCGQVVDDDNDPDSSLSDGQENCSVWLRRSYTRLPPESRRSLSN